jgi:hypothetical protein
VGLTRGLGEFGWPLKPAAGVHAVTVAGAQSSEDWDPAASDRQHVARSVVDDGVRGGDVVIGDGDLSDRVGGWDQHFVENALGDVRDEQVVLPGIFSMPSNPISCPVTWEQRVVPQHTGRTALEAQICCAKLSVAYKVSVEGS